MFTNMLYGALGALALLTVIPVARLLGRLGLGTRIRAGYRRLIGMTHFEEMVLTELRIYRTDVDRLSRDTNADVRRRDDRVRIIHDAQSANRARVTRLQREVQELNVVLRQYTDALGPMWTTAQGHSMPLRLLSTPHLKNILDGGFGTSETDSFIRRELERRRIDTDWRVRQSQGERPPTKTDYLTGRVTGDGRAMPPPLAVDPKLQARFYVLPNWARQIIEDLRSRRVSRVSKQNRERIERVLPQWAQDLIFDLVRRAKR